MIRFRRLNRPVGRVEVVGAVSQFVDVQYWELAFSEDELRRKLNGEMAEVIMPAKPWFVRLWRWFFPLQFLEIEDAGNVQTDPRSRVS